MRIYYVVTPKLNSIPRYADEGDYTRVYDLVIQITDNHEAAADSSSWCELATVGEMYDSDLFTIEIIEDSE